MVQESSGNRYGNTKVLAVAMEKGGTGKSTIAIITAIQAAMGNIPEVKKKVLVMDFDDQQNVSRTFLDMVQVKGHKAYSAPVHPDFNPSIPEHREWGGRSNSVDLYYGNPVLPYTSTMSDRIHILPSDGAMLKAFSDAASRGSKTLLEQIHGEIANWISEPDVQEEYDLIICDCPPGANLVTIPVLRACTHLIVPTSPESFGVDGMGKMMADIEDQNRSREEPINLIGILPNKVMRYNEHKASLDAMRADPRLGPHIAPFVFHQLKGFLLSELPLTLNSQPGLNSKAEDEIAVYVEWLRHKMYGTKLDLKKTQARASARTVGEIE